MAEPIYVFTAFKFTEAWYQLSEEEQESLRAKVTANREKVGVKSVIFCSSVWSRPTEYHWFMVDEYPDIETEQKLCELDDVALDRISRMLIKALDRLPELAVRSSDFERTTELRLLQLWFASEVSTRWPAVAEGIAAKDLVLADRFLLLKAF